MSERSPKLPTAKEWLALGVSIGRELQAGKQSRVFAASVDGRSVALKLTDARLVDQSLMANRALMTEQLCSIIAVATGPVPIQGELVLSVDGWFVTATPFVNGRQPDITLADDAQLMGGTLSRLHDALALLPEFAIPPVKALDADGDNERTRWQMLHGDFSDQNVIVAPVGPRVFDFDDCGYGPVEYDLANSLYMVLFDAEVNGTQDRYRLFRPAFLDGYAHAAGTAIEHSVVESLIGVRIEALGRWLDDLANAPIGIRASTPEWRNTLRHFVLSHGTSRSGDIVG